MLKLPSYNDDVEVFQTVDKGRGLRCKKDLAAGTIVGKEQPFCHVISQDMMSTYCHSCVLRQPKLYKCSKCKVIMYCCKSCQAADWPWHKYECKSIIRLGPNIVPESIRLLGRVAYTISQGQYQVDQFNSLMSNRDLLEKTRISSIMDGVALLKQYLSVKAVVDENEIIDIISRVTCNTFTICNSEMQTVGIGIYSGLSLVNHSCSPNCCAAFYGKEMQIHTIAKAKVGDELLISYIDPMQELRSRQHQLETQYCFKCICEKCMDKSESSCNSVMTSIRCPKQTCKLPTPLDLFRISKLCPACGYLVDESFFRGLDKFCNRIDEIVTLGYEKANLEDLKKLFTEVKQRLGQFHVLYIRVLENLMDACINSQHFTEALEYAKRLEKPYYKLYPDNYPTTGIHLMKLGKLECYLGNFQQAVNSLGKAKDILRISHGGECGLIDEINQMISI